MPNSYLTYTANGSTTDFSLVGIDGWISSSFLKVYANNVLQTTGYSFIGLTGASPLVRFAAAPTNGTIIRLQRETPTTVAGFQGNIVNFNDASVLTEADLDNMAKGLLHIAQEGNDTGSGALPPTLDTLNWDAKNKRITSVATPTANQDAATKGYVDGITLYGAGMALPQSWTFSGDASTTSFTLSPVAAQNDPQMFIVEVGGVIQRPTTDYTIPNVNTITFASAPPSGSNNVRIRNIGTTRNIASFSQNLTINGVSVGRGNNDQSLNTAVGSSALSSNTTGFNNTGVGYQALKSVVSGTGNTALGASALSVLTTTTNNTAVGAFALSNLTTGTGNTALGWAAGLSSNNTNLNTAVGYASLAANSTGSNNTSVGANALTSSTTSSYNTAVGAGGLANNTTGEQNTAVGYAAANALTTAIRTTAIGSSALQVATTPLDNTVVGALACRYTTTGNYNNALGSAALFANTTGGTHTALGHAALYNNTTGNSNIGVGHATLYGNMTGSNNIAVGVNAGRYIADGATAASKVDTSIFIGANSKVLATDNENSIVIGNNATGLGSNTTVIGNTSTVTTAIPAGKLTIGPTSGDRLYMTQDSGVAYIGSIEGGASFVPLVFTQGEGAGGEVLRLVNTEVQLKHGHITFPTPLGAVDGSPTNSTDPGTLDRYDERSYTIPNAEFGGLTTAGTYVLSTATDDGGISPIVDYVFIGNRVLFEVYFKIQSVTTAGTGQARLQRFGNPLSQTWFPCSWSGLGGGITATNVMARITPTSQYITFWYAAGAAANLTALPVTAFVANTIIRFNGSFRENW